VGILFVVIFAGISLVSLQRAVGPGGLELLTGIAGLGLCYSQRGRFMRVASQFRARPALAITAPLGYVVALVAGAAAMVAVLEAISGRGSVWWLTVVLALGVALGGHALMCAQRPRSDAESVRTVLVNLLPGSLALIVAVAAFRPDLAWLSVAGLAGVVVTFARLATCLDELDSSRRIEALQRIQHQELAEHLAHYPGAMAGGWEVNR